MRTKTLTAVAAIVVLTLTACGGSDKPTDPVSPSGTEVVDGAGSTGTGSEGSGTGETSAAEQTTKPEPTSETPVATLSPERIAELPSGPLEDFVPTVEVVQELAGFTKSEPAWEGGFFLILEDTNGCLLTHRVTTVDPPPGIVDEQALAKAQALDTLTERRGAGLATGVKIPSSGPDQQTYVIATSTTEEVRMAVATLAAFVTDETGALKQVTLDLVMQCPANLDAGSMLLKAAEGLKVTFPARP